MKEPSVPRLITKRLAASRVLLVSVFAGITVAATLAAGAPVYIKSLEQLAFSGSLDRISGPFFTFHLFGSKVALKDESLRKTERSIDSAIENSIEEIYLKREVYLRSETFLAGLPDQPLPPRGTTAGFVSRGYFQYLSNLENQITFLEGGMAGDVVSTGPDGPMLEAVIGTPAAENFDLNAGDVVTLTPHLAAATRVSVRITGILEPADAGDEYWGIAGLFLDPGPLLEQPPRGVEVDPDQPPLSLLVKRTVMVDGIGQIYDGSVVEPFWFLQVNKEVMKEWSPADTRNRLREFERQINDGIPGSSLATGVVRSLISNIERKSFFSKVPLLLLVAVLVVTVLFFLLMAVSYLVQSRERDMALMRTRGVGTLQVSRLYGLEGLVMAVVAVGLAPFLAMGAVALAGIAPYFHDMTGGGPLPVKVEPTPFLVAAAIGLVCLLVIMLSGVLGSRTGLLAHKLRSSRPPAIPFFHRYYLDVGLLALGGLLFWELQSRGRLVSGGLFGDVQINEALLLAPVLFLIVVALVFMRLFPLLVRYIAGESPALLHLVAAVTVLTLPTLVALKGIRATDGAGWLAPAAVPLAVGVSYWVTIRLRHPLLRLAGLAVQAGLVWGFVTLEPLMLDQAQFVPAVGLVGLVPAQVAYMLLRRSTRVMPVWASLTLWHMARNPLQYSWLVLLLVLVTGVAILSTTVGGTLQRSQTERILYDVAADIRVTGVSGVWDRGSGWLKEAYLSKPGVEAASVGFRDSGRIGPVGFQVLGLEPTEFPHMSWYRDDFSVAPLNVIMRALQPDAPLDKIEIPAGAISIGVWARPEEAYIDTSIWMVVQDAKGASKTLTLGKVGSPIWRLFKAEIPSELEPPLTLVSVQIFVPSHTSARSAGKLHLDAIHVTLGADGEELMLEDFETNSGWVPIVTSALSSDTLQLSAGEAIQGRRSGLFSFGIDMANGIRGIYLNPTAGPVPVVVSSSFARATGARVGERLVVQVDDSWIPVVIRDTADYFPTLSPEGGGFMLAEVESLLRYLNILKPTSSVGPNEVFLTEAPAGREALLQDLGEQVRVSGEVRDSAARLESVRLDPLATAGWRALVLLSLGIVLLAGTFGYVTYLLLFANRSQTEIGFLQSLGLSRVQLMGLLGFEHLTVVATGLALGSWAGLQMSRLMVSALAVTEEGEQVVPPFILSTDWGLMLPTYVGLIAVFLAALVVLTRSIGRPDLQTIARVADY